MAGSGPKRATYADVEAAPEHLVAEIIGGELVTHPRPSVRHGATEGALCAELSGPFQKGLGGPGGWVFVVEPEVKIGDDLLVPDVAGWRTTRFMLPEKNYMIITPDWVCEVLSESTARRDRTDKMRIYLAARIPHMWLIDPRHQYLEVFENKGNHWAKVADFTSDEMVRAVPFDAVGFSLANLWPLDRPLGLHEAPQSLYAGDR